MDKEQRLDAFASSAPACDILRLGLDELLTCEEVSIYTRTSLQTVWRQIRLHRLQAKRFGRSLRVPVSALRAWAETSEFSTKNLN